MSPDVSATFVHQDLSDRPRFEEPTCAREDARHRAELETIMGEGGIPADCGEAQNCMEVCPKEIPLVDSIAAMGRATTKHMLFGWLLK